MSHLVKRTTANAKLRLLSFKSAGAQLHAENYLESKHTRLGE